jgi:predicted nucleic acid-binding protein
MILETNIISEILKPAPSRKVLLWMAGQESVTTFLTSVTQAEILYAVESLPKGKRHTGLSIAIDRIFADEFSGRTMAFDEDAARAYSKS